MRAILSGSAASLSLVVLLATPLLAPVHGLAAASDEKPMLWETSWEQLEFVSFDPERSADPGLTKQTQLYCAGPYRPKLGKTVKDGLTCVTTRLSNRGGKYVRDRRCVGDNGVVQESKIRGYDDGKQYDLNVESTLSLANGKKYNFSRIRQKGRLVGECPKGFPVND